LQRATAKVDLAEGLDLRAHLVAAAKHSIQTRGVEHFPSPLG
jgi:hypothetical protein